MAGALALPAGAVARWLNPMAGEAEATGIWLLKAGLAALAIAGLALPRLGLGRGPTLHRAPLVALGSVRHERWWLAACLLVALALRLPALGSGLWYDEIETLVGHVRRPFGEIVTTYELQNQHLLYSLVARLGILGLGESAAVLRLPAVLFGVASIFAFYRFARGRAPADEALVGSALLAVSYHHVWFSQNARGYTGLLLFTLLATSAFYRLLTDERADGRSAAAYGLYLALGAYLHVTAVLVGVAHLLVLGWLAVRAKSPGRAALLRPGAGLLLGALLGFVLYAPVLPQLLATLAGPSPYQAETAWQNPLWLAVETLRGLAGGLPGGWLALAIGAGVLGLGLASYWRQDRVLAALLVLPGLLTAAVAVGLGHNLWPRFFFFSAGFAVAIAVRGGFALAALVFRNRGRAVAQAAAAAVVLGSGLTVPRAWAPKQDFEAAATFVEGARRSGDAVVTVDLTVYPYARYLDRDWVPVTSLDSLAAVERRHQRTWLLYTFPVRLAAVQPAIWGRLASGYDTAAVYPGTVGGGAVVVMVSRPTHPTS
jgi:hypothetical protein